MKSLLLARRCVLLLVLAGCSDPPTPSDVPTNDLSDVSTTDAVDATTDAELFVPRCDFPDGGASAEQINRGRLNTNSLCNFCHEQNPGAMVWAGQDFPRPRTTSYGANLTPHPTTGLGRRSDDQIMRSIRYGVAADGNRRLCEMNPFEVERLNDQALCDMLAYLKSIPAVDRAIPASTCMPR
jgi:hypothetical protein